MRDKSYPSHSPDLPPLTESGWVYEDGKYKPLQNLLPAPKAVVQLIKYGCKVECKGNCSCNKNNLPCTPLCKCANRECANRITDANATDILDEDADTDEGAE